MGLDAAPAATSPIPPQNPAFLAPPISPAPGVAPSEIGNNAATPAMLALPANTGTTTGGSNGPGIDANNLHKFWTISVGLRETYDDNVNTSNTNKATSLETSLSPSILVNFPMENTTFTAAYTFSGTYYSQTGGTGSNLQYSNQFSAQLNHDFSERFSVNASDGFIDSTEPNIFGTTGTPYRDGENISNAFGAGFNAQWTPLIGSQTTYSNTYVDYLDSAVATGQNSLENTASQTVSFTVVPKISVNFGGIYDTIHYDQITRGYTTYTGFVGGSWTVLPNISASLRGGGSYTTSKQLNTAGQYVDVSQVSPYVDLSGSWQIGERSSLTGDYSHEITPNDYVGANGQQSDRVSANFSYQVSPQLSTHLQLSYTYSDTSGALFATQGQQSYTESVYGLDVGAAYNFVKYFSLTLDIYESGVSSQISAFDYSRDQVSLGVRGTY